MKITKLTILKQEQVAIEITDNQVVIPHISTLHLVMKYHFEEGVELTQDQYHRFIKDNEWEILYQKALHFISYQMRTISEVKKHLAKTTKDMEIIQSIVNKLKEQHYVNDASYVDEYVKEKIEFDTVGPLYIKDKLIKKGIHYDLIDAQLLHFTDDIQFAKICEIIEKDIRYKLQKPYRKVVESILRRCLSKGFSKHVIDSAILAKQDDIIEQIDEDQLIEKELQSLRQIFDISDYTQQQKVIQKLIQKGYSYKTIKEHIQ